MIMIIIQQHLFFARLFIWFPYYCWLLIVTNIVVLARLCVLLYVMLLSCLLLVAFFFARLCPISFP